MLRGIAAIAEQSQRCRWQRRGDAEDAGQPGFLAGEVGTPSPAEQLRQRRQRQIERGVAQDLAGPEQAGHEQGQMHGPC
jgi:hypothetical protein